MASNACKWLKVSGNKRFLELEDGTPFFWLGDTAWELFHKLNREDALRYLSNRAELGFNVVQAVALAELDGVATPNAHGRQPFRTGADGAPDPLLPDTDGAYSYWDHVDYIVDAAAGWGLYIALLPTWGDKYFHSYGHGPALFDPARARGYGEWIAARYRDKPNIVWVLGGDRWLTTRLHFEIVNAMAEGLAQGDGGRHLMTFHPPGGRSSSMFMHHEDWLDFNMIQSGHRDLGERKNDIMVAADYAREPAKPVLDGEPCYEDHPRDHEGRNGYFDQADVRTAAYYAVLSGAFGHTYGHHSIWSMAAQPDERFIMTWEQALDRPGARQMRHLRTLIETFAGPDRMPDPQLIVANRQGADRMVAARGQGYALIYSPNGIPFEAATDRLGTLDAEAAWYNPRSGQWTQAGSFASSSAQRFVPPTSGRSEDWVLALKTATESSRLPDCPAACHLRVQGGEGQTDGQ